MESNQASLNAVTGTVQYGTRTTLNNDYDSDIKVKKSYDPIQCGGPWTKKKKLTVGFFCLLLLVIILVVIIAVLSLKKHNEVKPVSGGKEQSSSHDCDPHLVCSAGVRYSPTTCIKPEFLCDGFPDCLDGDDESKNSCEMKFDDWLPCNEVVEWKCRSGKTLCINIDERCDSVYNCEDGSDEMSCVEVDDQARVKIRKEGEKPYFLSFHGVLGDMKRRLCSLVGFSEFGARSNARVNETENYRTKPCAKFNSEDRYMSERLLRSIDIENTCDDGQIEGLTCQPDGCGQFGDIFDGPKIPLAWKQPVGDFSSSPPEDFPWIVYIMVNDNIKCLGTIISLDYVLTTKTCVSEDDFKKHRFVVQAGHSRIEQKRSVYKHIVHHGVEDGEQASDDDSRIILLELSSPFIAGKAVTPICVREPEMKDIGAACFASGMESSNGDTMKHVRLADCEIRDGDQTTVSDSALPCLSKTVGGPISSYDMEYNRFFLRGLIEQTTLGCPDEVEAKASLSINEGLARWTQQISAPVRDSGKLCRGLLELTGLRFPQGNREKEFYIEATGKTTSGWHAFVTKGSNRTVLEKLLIGKFGNKESLLIQETSSSDIRVNRVFSIDCPKNYETICDCSFTFKNATEEVVSYWIFHFQDDSDDDDLEYNYLGDDDDLDDSDYEIYDEIVDKDTTITCDNNQTISETFFCDNDAEDCDGSDEQLDLCLMYANVDQKKCEDAYICENNYECIEREQQCDGYIDCEDRSDEMRCVDVVPDNKMVVWNEKGLWYLILAKGLYDQTTKETNNQGQAVANYLCEGAGYSPYGGSMNASDLQDLLPIGARCKEVVFPDDNDPDADRVLPFRFKPVDEEECSGMMVQLECQERECGNPTEKEVGGVNLDMPWLAKIVDSTDAVTKCLATVISDEWIVAPLSCITDLNSTRIQLHGENPDTVSPYLQKNFQLPSVTLDGTVDNAVYRTNDITLLAVEKADRGPSQPICIGHPMMSRCVLHASKDGSDLETFKVKLMDDDECQEGLDKALQWNENFRCFIYPNITAPLLKEMRGSPIACYDGVTGRYSLAGIALGTAYSRQDRQDHVGIAVNVRDGDVEEWLEVPLIATIPGQKFELSDGNCKLRFYRGTIVDSYYVMFQNETSGIWYNVDPTETVDGGNKTASLFNLLERKFFNTEGLRLEETEGYTVCKNIAKWTCDEFPKEFQCNCLSNLQPAVPGQTVKIYMLREREYDWNKDLPEEYVPEN